MGEPGSGSIAVGYVRYSSEMQDPASIVTQKRVISEFADKKGWRIVRWYVEPEQSAMLVELIDQTQPDVIVKNMQGIGEENSESIVKAKKLILDYSDAFKKEEAQGAEDYLPPKRHWHYAGPSEHCLRPRPPCTRCGKRSCPIGHPGTAHPDLCTRNPLGTSDLGRSTYR